MSVISKCLKYFLCGVLCFVSMILTACFALSFGSVPSPEEGELYKITSILLLITIGVVLDLSKYIFWNASSKGKSAYFVSISIVLMIFSWIASVAFFVSTEDKKVSDFRKQSSEYLAYEQEIKSIKLAIDQKTLQSIKRLDSKFHEQWDKSENLTKNIDQLTSKLNNLILNEPNVGLDQAKSSMASIAFFDSISKITNLDSVSVRNLFYGLLALLIEVCALGLLTLCNGKNNYLPSSPLSAFESNIAHENKYQVDHDQKAETKNESIQSEGILVKGESSPLPFPEPIKSWVLGPNSKFNAEELRLIEDITSSSVPPVFRRIKDLDYGITQIRIREILQELKAKGYLTHGSRNSLVLADKPLASA